MVALLYLLQLSGRGAALSDAAILQAHTGMSALVWALLWTAIGVLIQLVALCLALWRTPPHRAPSRPALPR